MLTIKHIREREMRQAGRLLEGRMVRWLDGRQRQKQGKEVWSGACREAGSGPDLKDRREERDMEKLMTIKEAAKYVKVSVPSFKKFISRYEEFGDVKLIEKEELDKIIARESLKENCAGGN